jgi:hypothetical protein
LSQAGIVACCADRVTLIEARAHHKSFQCSALFSPLMRWSILIEEYRETVHALETGDPSLIRVFENSRLGKAYAGRVDRIGTFVSL